MKIKDHSKYYFKEKNSLKKVKILEDLPFIYQKESWFKAQATDANL